MVAAPTNAPTDYPTGTPTAYPTGTTTVPTSAPTASGATHSPTDAPTDTPTGTPTGTPTTLYPTAYSASTPSAQPTAVPTQTMVCACNPTVTPTAAPTSADAAEVITGSFSLSGLTTSDVTNEFAAAIKDSLAASLTGVDSSMVVLTFTAATSRRMTESLRGVWGWTGRRLSSGLSVSYTITGLSAANAAAAATTAGAFDSSETFADSITTNLATIGVGWEGGVSGSTAAAATEAPSRTDRSRQWGICSHHQLDGCLCHMPCHVDHLPVSRAPSNQSYSGHHALRLRLHGLRRGCGFL